MPLEEEVSVSTPEESYLVGLLGSGITTSLTPPLHEFAADRAGIRYLYRPIDIETLGPARRAANAVPVGELLRWGLDLGYNAFNITFPYKQAVLEHLDEVSDAAARLGAVNTVIVREAKILGYNTDVTGFASALTQGLAPSPGDLTTVTQLGVGGAGSATADALLKQGVEELLLFDSDHQRTQAKATQLAGLYPGASVRALAAEQLPAALARSRGLVNATPIGMHHHPGSPLPLSLLHPNLWVADVIYLPQNTALIKQARTLGCRVLPGGLMAVGQAADAFELITGIRPNVTDLLAHFETLLVARGNQLP